MYLSLDRRGKKYFYFSDFIFILEFGPRYQTKNKQTENTWSYSTIEARYTHTQSQMRILSVVNQSFINRTIPSSKKDFGNICNSSEKKFTVERTAFLYVSKL